MNNTNGNNHTKLDHHGVCGTGFTTNGVEDASNSPTNACEYSAGYPVEYPSPDFGVTSNSNRSTRIVASATRSARKSTKNCENDGAGARSSPDTTNRCATNTNNTTITIGNRADFRNLFRAAGPRTHGTTPNRPRDRSRIDDPAVTARSRARS